MTNPLVVGAIGGVISTVTDLIDDLVTTDKERLDAELEFRKIDAGLLKDQTEVNKVEAGHESIWVSGWRPGVGWCGVAGLAYQFLVYPFMVWGWTLMQAKGWIPTTLAAPPMLDTEALMVLLTGMLGIAGLRSLDKRTKLTPK